MVVVARVARGAGGRVRSGAGLEEGEEVRRRCNRLGAPSSGRGPRACRRVSRALCPRLSGAFMRPSWAGFPAAFQLLPRHSLSQRLGLGRNVCPHLCPYVASTQR